MNSIFDVQTAVDFVDRELAALVAGIFSVDFLIQIAAIVLSGMAAAAVASRLVRLSRRLLSSLLTPRWVELICIILASIATSGLWLIVLGVTNQTARSQGLAMPLAEAVVSLLAAWVVIRLLSHVVRHPLWSRVIFFTAWTVAALDIVGVLDWIVVFLDGAAIQLGRLRVSALGVVRALIVLAILLWLAALLKRYLERRITRAENLTPSLQTILVQALNIILPVIAVLAVLPVMGLDLTALTVFGGALAVGIGLGLQRTAGNLVSGFMLITGGSVKPGDVIAIRKIDGEGTFGRVTSISMRFVSVRTRDGIEELIPNEKFMLEGVENWSRGDQKIRVKVPFRIAYESDVGLAIRLALESAAAVKRIVADPQPVCLVRAFADYAVDMELRVWIGDPMNGISNVKSDCYLGMQERFAAAGIRIPLPRQDVRFVEAEQGTTSGGGPERPRG